MSDLNSRNIVPAELEMLKDLLHADIKISFCFYNDKGNIESLTLNTFGISYDTIYFPYLAFLQLHEMRETDISAIKRHSNLEIFFARNQGLKEIPPINGLRKLKNLGLTQNKIKSLEGLRHFRESVNLEGISLPYNEITDLCEFKPLSHFPKLKRIELYCNKIIDVNITQDVPNLKALQLSNNNIRHITAIKNLSGVKRINLSNSEMELKYGQNKLTKLENLFNLPKLTHINVTGNPITSFEGIENLPRLKSICYLKGEYLNDNLIQEWKSWFKNLGFKVTGPKEDRTTLGIYKREYPSLKFKINEHLSLKLKENGETMIKVNGKYFITCKALLFQIPTNKMDLYDNVGSIDEIVEEVSEIDEEILPETEFWGHCSNLQAWYENDYNTQLLTYYIAFPLLKKLTEAGDQLAKKVFKEEIAKRYASGYPSVIEYLKKEGYLNYLKEEELNSIK